MVVRRIGVLSAGKVLGALYALLGLIIGLFYALFALLFALIGVAGAANSQDALIGGAGGVIFGVLSVVLFPLFYGILGFIGGILSAFLYNLIARFVGGIELDVQQRTGRVS